jgi:hypothetical protein
MCFRSTGLIVEVQPFSVSGCAEHTNNFPRVSHCLKGDGHAALIHRATQRNMVRLVECGRVEPLAEHENVAHDVATAADLRFVMTT